VDFVQYEYVGMLWLSLEYQDPYNSAKDIWYSVENPIFIFREYRQHQLASKEQRPNGSRENFMVNFMFMTTVCQNLFKGAQMHWILIVL